MRIASIVVALLSLGGSGCARTGMSTERAVLEDAYKTGILSRDEYHAKLAALNSHARALEALDKTLATGAVTPADYQILKARLIAQASPATPREVAPPTEVAATPPSAALPLAAAPAPAAQTSGGNESAAVQGGLKTINPPQGGQIVYGQVDGQTTEAGAMGAVLRSLHERLGDRPQVGKLFQVNGTQSVAAFFSVSRKSQGGGQVAGLIIATKASSDHVEAALLSDDAARFSKTLNPMMKTLFATWHPLAAARTAGQSPNGPAPLHQVTLPDRSASVALPDNWNVVPKMSGGGTLVAMGPNGESAELGITFLAADTNNPRVQQTLQVLRNGGLRNTSYASATYYPYGGDLAKTFVYMMQNVRHKAGLPEAVYNFSSVTPLPAGQQRCVRITGTSDLRDGKGDRELTAVYCTSPPAPAGSWMSMAYTTAAPVQVAAAERATLGAILQSFSVNNAVVAQESARISQPAIDHIHAIGRAASQQAAAAHERNDIQNSSVYQRWDSLDKRSQEFENYQLGFSVISDTENTAHGTFWNEDAEALVKSNPDRFQYVSAPNYWKGIDY